MGQVPCPPVSNLGELDPLAANQEVRSLCSAAAAWFYRGCGRKAGPWGPPQEALCP